MVVGDKVKLIDKPEHFQKMDNLVQGKIYTVTESTVTEADDIIGAIRLNYGHIWHSFSRFRIVSKTKSRKQKELVW